MIYAVSYDSECIYADPVHEFPDLDRDLKTTVDFLIIRFFNNACTSIEFFST